MSLSELSASSQNYLKAVWGIQEWTGAPVSTSALAAKAGVKLSTASDASRKLAEQGLLEHTPYGGVTLTPKGRGYAVAMVRRHRLIETFLVEVLGFRWDQVHDEAETLEHAVSDLLIDRIDEHLGHPTRDPHGDPIPAPDGTVETSQAVQLTRMPAGGRARVERISDEDPELLQYFASRGIGIGAVIALREGAPYSDSMEVEVPGVGAVVLGSAALGAVWATPEP